MDDAKRAIYGNNTFDSSSSIVHGQQANTFTNFSLTKSTENASQWACTEAPAREITPFEIATIALSIMAIFVNTCVLIVIYIGPRAFRTPTFFFISSLASADLLTGATVLCAIFLPVGDKAWERIILKGIAVVSFSASVNSLIVIAFDRYMKIRDEKAYNKIFTNCHAASFIGLSWLFATVVFLVVPLLGWSCTDLRCLCPYNCMCICDSSTCSQSLMPFTKSYVAFGVAYFYFSLSIMAMLYLAIFASVRKRSGFRKKRGGSIVGQMPNRGPFVMLHRRREIKLAKTLVIVMGVFFICWLPVTTLFIFDAATENPSLAKLFDYCLVSAVIHPLLNPIIYSMRLPRMWCTFKYMAFAVWRRLFKKVMSCCSKDGIHYNHSSRHRGNSVISRHSSDASSLYSPQSFKYKVAGNTRERVNTNSATTQVSTLIQESSPPPLLLDDGDGSVFLPSSSTRSQSVARKLPESYEKGVSLKKKLNSRVSNFANCRNTRPSCIESSSGAGNKGKSNNGRTNKSATKNEMVVLASGAVIPRCEIRISPPFNAEKKITWE